MGYMAEDVQDQKVELNNEEINENTEKEKHLEKKIIPSNESNKFSNNNFLIM